MLLTRVSTVQMGCLSMLEAFAQDMLAQQQNAAGLLRSAYGKARGLALRLSLNLEMLRWAAVPGYTPPPTTISEEALAAACDLVAPHRGARHVNKKPRINPMETLCGAKNRQGQSCRNQPMSNGRCRYHRDEPSTGLIQPMPRCCGHWREC